MKGMGDGPPSHFLVKSLVSNESINASPVQIVVKDYLRFHWTEILSV